MTTRAPMGVRVPHEQSGTEQGPAQTIRGFARAEFFLVEYFDARGTKHEVTVIRFGNKWFMPPNSEQWTHDCKALSPWLEKALDKQYGKQSETPTEVVALPESDVEVVG